MKRVIYTIIASLFVAGATAQTSLNVEKKDGSHYVISLDDFEKASFDDSNPTQPEVIIQEVEVEKIVEVIKKDTVEIEKTVEVIKKDTVKVEVEKLVEVIKKDTVEIEKTVEVIKRDTVKVEVEKLVEVIKKDTVEIEKLVTVHDTIDKLVDKIVEIHDTINVTVTDTVKVENSSINPLVFRNAKGELCYRVSFEDDDLIALPLTGSLTTGEEPTKWSDLIDDPQYGGSLLYGTDGMGGDCTYTFIDQFSGLMAGHQAEFTGADITYGNAYWSGGLAVSNYYNSSIEEGGYTTQLEVYSTTENGGANGSENFLMSYGYNDVEQTAVSYDSRPYIGNMYGDFTIESLYVNNSTYLLHSVGYGDGFNSAANEETQVMFVLEGYRDAAEEDPAGTVVFYLVKDGVPVTTWSKVDCSALGKCDHFRINITASEDQSGPYGLNVPAYVAIDDIVVSR